MKKQFTGDVSGTVVERATDADVPRMAELLRELFTIEHDFEPRTERQIAGLRQLLLRSDATVYVARDRSGRAVGMVAAQLVISTAEGALSVWIEDVIVERAMRGRGVGRGLLDAALAWARAAGATRAQLLIDADNEAAEAFYACLGWQKTQLSVRRLSLQGKI